MILNLTRVSGSLSYVAVMTIAAGVALIRAFFVAGILDVPSFGLYVTIVAAGMFSSSLVSFGVYERTIKAFPRLWVEQRHRSEMIKQADKSSQRLVLRVSLALILLLACIFAGDFLSLIQKGVLVALVALSSSVVSIYASAIRATGQVDLLARNTLIRSLIVIMLGILGAYFFGWRGAIVGEVSGALLGALITRHSVIQQTKLAIENTVPVSQSDSVKISSGDGLWFFFASLLISIPVYLRAQIHQQPIPRW